MKLRLRRMPGPAAGPAEPGGFDVLAGAPDDLPVEFRQVVADLRGLGQDVESRPFAGTAAALAFRARRERAGRKVLRRLGSRASVVGASVAVGVGGFTAAAYAGVLPGPVQHFAHQIIHAPERRPDPAPDPTRPAPGAHPWAPRPAASRSFAPADPCPPGCAHRSPGNGSDEPGCLRAYIRAAMPAVGRPAGGRTDQQRACRSAHRATHRQPAAASPTPTSSPDGAHPTGSATGSPSTRPTRPSPSPTPPGPSPTR